MLSWVQDLESFASSDAFQDLLILRGETLQLLPLSLGWSSFRSLIEINDVSTFIVVGIFYHVH